MPLSLIEARPLILGDLSSLIVVPLLMRSDHWLCGRIPIALPLILSPSMLIRPFRAPGSCSSLTPLPLLCDLSLFPLRKGGVVEPADGAPAEGTEVRKQFLLAPSDPPISAPSRRHLEKSRTRRHASFSSSFPKRGGRTAPKKKDGRTYIVGLDRGTRSRRGTYYGTGTYCGTGEGACGILKVWNFKVRVQGWGLEFSLGLLGQRGTLIVPIPRARADERGEQVELQNGF